MWSVGGVVYACTWLVTMATFNKKKLQEAVDVLVLFSGKARSISDQGEHGCSGSGLSQRI